MSTPLILVTGATGKTGAAVVELLRAKGARVRALVRARDRRSERLHALGAEVVVADMFDPVQIGAAMRGISRAYYVPPWHPQMLHSAVSFATAAREARVEAIVGLSQWLASPSHPSLATRQLWLVERLFATLPETLHITIAPGFFADNYLSGFIRFAAQLGVLPFPGGESRNAPPSNEDIARVVVGTLLDPERHAGGRYRPTGPQLLSVREMAAALGDALDRPVRHVETPIWMMMKAIHATGSTLGIDDYLLSGLRHYYEEHQRGTFALGAPTTHVRDVADVEPEDFATIARRYARRPEAQRTRRNQLRALGDFIRVGVIPASNLDRFVQRQQHPLPYAPELAANSAQWAREHLTEPTESLDSVGSQTRVSGTGPAIAV